MNFSQTEPSQVNLLLNEAEPTRPSKLHLGPYLKTKKW